MRTNEMRNVYVLGEALSILLTMLKAARGPGVESSKQDKSACGCASVIIEGHVEHVLSHSVDFH